ncbi:MAG TPA: EF-hand domain-containing protein [Planctomycetota bacterium]|jgi:hypothetical protein|nr:EF-hand domain-containing protein [Planctomycetota bacterium]
MKGTMRALAILPGILGVAAGIGTPRRAAAQGSAPAALEEEEVRARFRFADRNRNGWISLREAEECLSLDRAVFARFDRDRDGRVTLEEFARRCRTNLRAGAPLPGPPFPLRVPPPESGSRGPLPPWLAPLDRTRTGRIPIEPVLAKIGATSAARAAFALADRDGDRALDLEELAALGLATPPSSSRPAP